MTELVHQSKTTAWINRFLILCVALVVGMIVALFNQRAAEVEARHVESSKWDQMLLATDVGLWRWNVTKDELHWDEAIKKIYGIDDKAFVPSYTTFASQVAPEDIGWVNQVVQKTLNEKSSYRAVFRLKNGRYIRAYGKVITRPDGTVIFAGVCLPADASEYTGKPIAMLNSKDQP
jgi:PAS domain-containing protein